jgi:flagellar hook-associated protein 1 FlgK
MISLFVGNGQPLVVGTQANTLSTANSLNDPTRREVVFSAGGGSQPITQFVTGGTIGGLLKFRQNTLDTTLNTLGQIALNVADAMNQQQRMGLDLNGNFGGNLFTDINTASSMQTRALATNTNTGSAQLQVFIDNASALTTGDYRLNFTSATAYQLVNANGSALTPPVTGAIGALPATIATADGFQIRVPTGSTFAAGDSFIIQPTRQGASALNVALQKPEELAFAQPIRTSANLSNRGGGGISAGSMIAAYQANGTTREPTFATNGALTPPILIRFTSATTFDILDNTNPAAPVAITTGVAFTPGQNNTVTINDTVTGDPVYKFDVYGNPATGDQFNVNYNTNGSSDNRNALALTALQQTKTIGNASFDDAYGQLVATVGSNAAQLKINSDAADSVLTQTQASRDAVSGVNLDEEAANLIKYQQAYNASAQIITVARSLFDTLLAAFR